MSSKQTFLFCDTTVIYYKLHGHPLHRQAISDMAGQSRLAVSAFVVGEYTRGYVIGLIELYFAIREEGSVQNGILIFNGEMGNRPRRLANAFQSATGWLCGFVDWSDVQKTLRRLGEYIRTCVYNIAFEFPKRVRDPLACEVGVLSFRREEYTEDLIFDFYAQYQDVQSEPGCGQCRFRASQLAELAATGIDLYSSNQRDRHAKSKGYVQQAEWLEKAARSEKDSPTCWYCERLGDSIIALSAPKDMPILTGDANSFPVLGKLLGKQVVLIPSLKELKERPPAVPLRRPKKRRRRR